MNNWRENDHISADEEEEQVSAAAYDPTERQVSAAAYDPTMRQPGSMDVSHVAYDPTVRAPQQKVNATDRIKEERERRNRTAGGAAIPEDTVSHHGAGSGGYSGASTSHMSGYADSSQMSSAYADTSQMSMGYANQSMGYAQASERSSNL